MANSLPFLNQLNFVVAKKPVRISSTEKRRLKFVARVDDQINFAKGVLNGELYAAVKLVRRNNENGERELVAVKRKVIPWFWKDEKGRYFIIARYGRHYLELTKGKLGIVAGSSVKEVIQALETLKQAAKSGELDECLLKASVIVGGGKYS